MSLINFKKPLNNENLRIFLVDCAGFLYKMLVFWKKITWKKSYNCLNFWERTVNTIQIMPSNKAMWNYGSRTIAPNPKTNPNSNTNPNRGQFSLGAIVWFSSNPKTNPDLDTNPSPNQGQFLRRVIVRIPKLHLPDAFTVGFKQNWKIIVFNIIANFKFYLLTVL